MKRLSLVMTGLLTAALALTACGGDPPAQSERPEGHIVVLTQRTDIVGTVFQEYKQRFEAAYPGVTVEFEAITAYEDELAIRMNSDEYGDVLFSIVMLGRKLGLDAEESLERANAKFRERFVRLESLLERDGIRPEEAGPERLDRLWSEAKRGA